MTLLRDAITALRGFARGFLGLATLPRDGDAARKRIADDASRRPRCC